MKRARRIKLLLFLLPICLAACSDSREIEQDKLVKIYVDILIAEETYFDNTDSLQIKYDEIFDGYNVSEEDYRKQIEIMALDKEEWDRFFNKAYVYIDTLKSRHQQN